jgi:hypothetical protein
MQAATAIGLEHCGRLYSFSLTVVSAIALVEIAAITIAILNFIAFFPFGF